MEKIFCRLFEAVTGGGYLAILPFFDGGYKLITYNDGIATLDVPPSEFKLWRPVIKRVFRSVIKGEFDLVSDVIKTFPKSIESLTPEFTSFDLPTLPEDVHVVESGSSYGTIEKRKFSIDFTKEPYKTMAAENDARLRYYVKPDYFGFLERNLSNSFIKGLALIGKPGTGKSTDAIAVVRHLGGAILVKQVSNGMMENDLFFNIKPNGKLTALISKLGAGEALDEKEKLMFDLLSKASGAFLEEPEAIMLGILLDVPVLIDELANANAALLSKFNVLTDGSVAFLYGGTNYSLPKNFFIFFTWNPGDEGTNDIPQSLKTRFPVLIVPPISKTTHRKRIERFCDVMLSTKADKVLVDALYDFGNLIEEKQNEFRHHGGSFTMRATQMFLSVVLCFNHSKEEFELELKSKFVNPLWGTNFENTEKIDEKLKESLYQTMIDEIYARYVALFVSKSVVDYKMEELLAWFASAAAPTVEGTADPTSVEGMAEDWTKHLTEGLTGGE